MATTNFEQWNPSSLNQETDAEYLADTQRLGGVTTGSLAPSATMNKFYYQASTFIAAFGQMLASKGYTNSDSSVATLASVLANVVTDSDLATNIISVAYSPTPAFNASSNNGFQMTLSGNITASSITGVTPGQLLAFYFVQDSVGGRTVSWPSSFVGALQPDTAAASVSVMLFRADTRGIARAVSPMISNNGVFIGALTAQSFKLASGASLNQVLSWNGTSFVPTTLAGFTSGSNANGNWVKDPTGHIHQWQSGISSNGVVWFPIAFTSSSNIVVIVGSNHAGAESPGNASSINQYGFTIGVGGGGDQSSYTADGY